ncbi:MAG: hypothetical protein OER90_05965 [Gemmatimonadota bacterium]|nr:hypothetical protein [Gemmatimonadota bacterium]
MNRHPARLSSTLALLGILSSALPGSVLAQDLPQPTTRPLVAQVSHWGRWVTLLGAGGLIAAAAVRHSDAQGALAQLEDFCRQDLNACALIADGSGSEVYASDQAEVLYAEYASRQQNARSFLLGGQISLLASGTMFLIDLLHRVEDFDNIPYTPLELFTGSRHLGFTIRF